MGSVDKVVRIDPYMPIGPFANMDRITSLCEVEIKGHYGAMLTLRNLFLKNQTYLKKLHLQFSYVCNPCGIVTFLTDLQPLNLVKELVLEFEDYEDEEMENFYAEIFRIVPKLKVLHMKQSWNVSTFDFAKLTELHELHIRKKLTGYTIQNSQNGTLQELLLFQTDYREA